MNSTDIREHLSKIGILVEELRDSFSDEPLPEPPDAEEGHEIIPVVD